MAGAARAERELRPGSEAWRRTTEVRIPTLTLTLTLTQTLTLTLTLRGSRPHADQMNRQEET